MLWYAVQYDAEDTDWGYGFEDLEDAKRELQKFYTMGYTEARIAVISGQECIKVLTIDDI